MLLGVMIFQFLERVPDRQAVELKKYHLAWKLALNLKLSDQGFHPTTLVYLLSELVRAHGLGRSRYRGFSKVELQNLFIGAACNIKRWLRIIAALTCALNVCLGPFQGPLKQPQNDFRTPSFQPAQTYVLGLTHPESSSAALERCFSAQSNVKARPLTVLPQNAPFALCGETDLHFEGGIATEIPANCLPARPCRRRPAHCIDHPARSGRSSGSSNQRRVGHCRHCRPAWASSTERYRWMDCANTEGTPAWHAQWTLDALGWRIG